MISQCRICKQDMSDDNRTLVGKPFKACSRCRHDWKLYCYSRMDNCLAKQHVTTEQRQWCKEYQLKYRNLMKCPFKNFTTKRVTENDFTITFN